MTIIPKQLIIHGADFTSISISQSSYSISTTILNGTYSGADVIQSGSVATVTLIPGSGYYLPPTISVSGAEYSYDKISGVVTLSNPTADVVVMAECVAHIELTYLNSKKSLTSSAAESYFRTGIYANNSIGFRYKGYRKIDVQLDVVAFGCRESNGDNRFFCGGYGGKYYCGWNTTFTLDGMTLGYHEWDVNYKNSRKLSVDGVDLTTGIGNLVNTKEIVLVCYNGYSSGGLECFENYYDCAGIEITSGSEVIRNFIPVRVGNVGCFYDTINGTYNYSDTEIEFVKGPDKT